MINPTSRSHFLWMLEDAWSTTRFTPHMDSVGGSRMWRSMLKRQREWTQQWWNETVECTTAIAPPHLNGRLHRPTRQMRTSELWQRRTFQCRWGNFDNRRLLFLKQHALGKVKAAHKRKSGKTVTFINDHISIGIHYRINGWSRTQYSDKKSCK